MYNDRLPKINLENLMQNTDSLTYEQEFASMRNTIAKFIQVIKKYDERIKVLEAKTADVQIKTQEKILLDRYTASSLNNRNLNADPKAVAFAAHLYYIKQVPAVRISNYGLLSQSKMQGLSTWDNQHLLDYCTLNDVMGVYQDGLIDEEAKSVMTDWAGMQDYLDSRANEEASSPNSSKLDKAFKRVNEQQAKSIDLATS